MDRKWGLAAILYTLGWEFFTVNKNMVLSKATTIIIKLSHTVVCVAYVDKYK